MPASGTIPARPRTTTARRPGTLALRRAATAAACAALLVGVVAAVPAQAAKPGTPAGFHPEQDFAGSTVAAHEGRGHASAADTASAFAALAVTQTKGMDVSGYQGNVAWSTAYANGGRFAYVKATEGTGYTNPYFAQQYNGSYSVGMIRGAYHFALPNASSGATQAAYFVAHGGGWSKDGKTLPPALDIEYNPYGATCYGLSQAGMVSWIRDFSNTVHTKTGRYPTIYTTTDWWNTCTGGNASFGATNPLWIARYSTSVGTLPAGWAYQTIWQYSDSGTLPGDQNYFNGALDRVQALANG
ncbi:MULTISPECIES: lysozyme [Kitasatospora]|uniref:Lysozyme n=1 Tax=Kitasatospora setae (strain ATCC 33774 / DSM 43861 / JCM 3304 / KCC A-0304 / NBRC 14216 / KM-6054) TaxID=452652 RepID=E4N6V1_KITSK|nr:MULTISPECIES: lysozyme [Kitasatospora]BAJ26932.1 putative lysozyme precursor [Kitasatospora setae KM-6054]